MPLFKYSPATATAYFNPCTLRFSPPGDFNDPFDGVSTAASIIDSATFKQAVANHIGFSVAQLAADPQLAAGAAEGRRIAEDIALEGYRDRLIADLNQNFRVLCLSKAPVYIGLYADPKLIGSVKANLATNPALRHVSVRRVTAIDPRDYKFRISD